MTSALTAIVESAVENVVDFFVEAFSKPRRTAAETSAPPPRNIRKEFLESRGVDPKELSFAEQEAKLAMIPKAEWENIKLAPFAIANGITVYDMVRVHRSMDGIPWESMK